MNDQKILNGCDVIIRFSFYALIYFLPISIAFVEAFASLALIAFFVKRGCLVGYNIKKEEAKSFGSGLKLFLQFFQPAPSSLNWPIGIFILVNFISVIFSQHHILSLQGFFFKLLQGVYIYFTFIEGFNTKKHLEIFLKIFLISAAVVSINGITQYATGREFIFGQELMDGRVRSSLRHPNDFGAYLLVIVPVTMALMLFWFLPHGIPRKKIGESSRGNDGGFAWPLKLGVSLLLIAALFSLGATYSRGAWMGFLLALIFWALLEAKYIPVIGIIIVLFWQIFFPQMELTRKVSFVTDDLDKEERMLHEMRKDRRTQTEDYSILDYSKEKLASLQNFQGMGRKIFWQQGIEIFKSNPILGSGLNTYSKIASTVYVRGGGYAHNCYLQMAAEIGFIGLLSFLGILFVLYRDVLWVVRRSAPTFWRAFLIGLVIGLTGFLIHSFFDTNLYSVQLANFFWLILGMVMIALNVVRQDTGSRGID